MNIRKIMRVTVLVVTSTLLASCATSYQKLGAGGGFSETRLADNMFKIHIKANAYSSAERADDFALLRASELSVQNGYKYFTVLNQDNSTEVSTVTMPSTYNTRGTLLGGMNNTAFYNSRTTRTGGQSFNMKKPRVTMTISCYKEKPADQFAYDAHLIYDNLTTKYELPKTIVGGSANVYQASKKYGSETRGVQLKEVPAIMSSERVAKEAASNCSVGYVHATPGMQNMSKITLDSTKVLNIMDYGDGWTKAWVQMPKGDGNVYYNLEKNRVVCGETGWKKYSKDPRRPSKIFKWSTGSSPFKKDKSASSDKSSSTMRKDFRPIAVKWEGYTQMFAGKIELEWKKKNGKLSIKLPNNDGTCTGRYQFTEKRKGTWSVACTNGLAASGTMQGYGSGNGSSGEGTDIHGKKVTFTLGGG